MKPVDQEFLHAPEAGQYGDCQRAVIASLLDLPITEVPHFLQIAKGDPTLYWEGIQRYLGGHGLAYLTIPAISGGGFFGRYEGVYHEISGPSPRGGGAFHAVIGLDGQVVFDPHPSRAGILGGPKDWEFSYLVRIGVPT